MENVKEKLFVVYKHTNVINKKIYIGITSTTLKRRCRNGIGYIGCVVFYRAIQKYGWNNFKSEILFKNLAEDEAKSKEIELIKKYKTQNRKYGYNISEGGGKRPLGIKHTEETKKKISQLQHMSVNGKPPNAKKIICLDTLEIFDSICDAGRKLNVNDTRIRDVLRKKVNSHKGLHFEYLKDYDPNKQYDLTVGHTKESKRKIREYQINNVNNKPVICLETGKIYPSVAETGRQLNICFSSIGCVCRGSRKTVNGLHFKYYINGD